MDYRPAGKYGIQAWTASFETFLEPAVLVNRCARLILSLLKDMHPPSILANKGQE